jgi:hypothetical protein
MRSRHDNARQWRKTTRSPSSLEVAVSRLRAMQHEDHAWASGTLLLLSGVLKIEDTVHEKIKEAGMINLLENKVLGPMILQAEETGRIKGIEQGIEQGMNTLLHELLSEKFRPLPEWAAQRLLHEPTLESILR